MKSQQKRKQNSSTSKEHQMLVNNFMKALEEDSQLSPQELEEKLGLPLDINWD